MEQQYCKVCKTVILPTYSFCPTCGIKLKEDELTVSVGKQIGVYLLSFFLPPLGLWPGIKYLTKGNEHSKHVGVIAIFLTILGIIISLWTFFGVIHSVNNALNQQINLKQLGY